MNTPNSPATLFPVHTHSHWEEGHTDYPVSSWQHEVADGDTRQGYWEWLDSQLESNDPDFYEKLDRVRARHSDTAELFPDSVEAVESLAGISGVASSTFTTACLRLCAIINADTPLAVDHRWVSLDVAARADLIWQWVGRQTSTSN